MPPNSRHRYQIVLPGQLVGPFDRRTIVGMRIKKLLDNQTQLLRSDGLAMTVAQLMMDRFEMADDERVNPQVGATASGLWPTFGVDFGGQWHRAGAWGFIGKGELRYQGDMLRLSGKRKGRLFGSTMERVKLPVAGIAMLQESIDHPRKIEITLHAKQPLAQMGGPLTEVLTMDNEGDVRELLALMRQNK